MKQNTNKEIQTELSEMMPKYPQIKIIVIKKPRIVKDILFMDEFYFVGNYKNHKICISRHESGKSFEIEVVNPKNEKIVSGWFTEYLGLYLKNSIDCLGMAIEEILSVELNADFLAMQFIDKFDLNFQTLLLKEGNMAAMNFLFKEFQTLLFAGNFKQINNVFNLMDFSKYPLTFLIGLLSVTNPCKSQLKKRSLIVKHIRKEYMKELSKERIENLLKGLL